MVQKNVFGFIVKNFDHRLSLFPTGDAFSYDSERKVIAVADAVTRDPCKYLPDKNRFYGKMKFVLLSHLSRRCRKAGLVSRLFCHSALEVLRDYNRVDDNTLKEVIKEVNEDIKVLNEDLGITPENTDYLANDLYGCTASLAAVDNRDENYLHYATIADSFVGHFGGYGLVHTKDLGPDSTIEERAKITKELGLNWRMPEGRRFSRSKFRNNPEEPLSFGVLTGEETAMHYIQSGTYEINSDERVIAYTDGLKGVIDTNLFKYFLGFDDPRMLRKYCQSKVDNEGALVVMNV
jgi:hypothetical protein